MPKVTADTITDEQIRELLRYDRFRMQWTEGAKWLMHGELVALYERALGSRRSPAKGAKRKARIRCAEIWNARYAGSTTVQP